jgi:hypothetical protein
MPPRAVLVFRQTSLGKAQIMQQGIAELAPTTNAATAETEPEVVAAIASAEGNPDLPLSFRTGAGGIRHLRMAVLLAAGIAAGYGVSRWWLRRRG